MAQTIVRKGYQKLNKQGEHIYDALKNVSYKDGTILSVQNDNEDIVVCISLLMPSLDGTNTTKIVDQVVFDYVTILGLSYSFVQKMVFEKILEMETHEVIEWFKVDEKCLVDPHPELCENAKHGST